jgi:hypothetical protein
MACIYVKTDGVATLADYWCETHDAPSNVCFNPHQETTSDGTLIVPGLRVLDYNRNETTVVADRDADRDYNCIAHPDYQFEAHTVHGCFNGWEKPTHWFTTANGGMFDGSRMQAIR